MSVREIGRKPDTMSHFPDDTYRWLELHDCGDVYGHAAVAERGDALELHVSFLRWGPQVRRNVRNDVEWVKEEARRLGKKRIMGVRANGEGSFDPKLFRFATLFGFIEKAVFQTVTMRIKL